MAFLSDRRFALGPPARRVVGVLAAGLFLSALHGGEARTATLEYAVKANYLFKFGPFVEWPPRASDRSATHFTVCVSGQDPFGPALDQAVRGQTVNGRPIAVRRIEVVSRDLNCHVLYMGRSGRAAENIKALRGAPVLTVTDESQGVRGGIVHFVLRGGRVRFMVDARAAQASGLVISSKLLALAAPPGLGG